MDEKDIHLIKNGYVGVHSERHPERHRTVREQWSDQMGKRDDANDVRKVSKLEAMIDAMQLNQGQTLQMIIQLEGRLRLFLKSPEAAVDAAGAPEHMHSVPVLRAIEGLSDTQLTINNRIADLLGRITD